MLAELPPREADSSLMGQLLTAFPGALDTCTTLKQPLHGVVHVIETTGRPVFAKARMLHPEKLRTAVAEFRELEQVSSATPIVLGLPLYIWYLRRTATGGPVKI